MILNKTFVLNEIWKLHFKQLQIPPPPPTEERKFQLQRD